MKSDKHHKQPSINRKKMFISILFSECQQKPRIKPDEKLLIKNFYYILFTTLYIKNQRFVRIYPIAA